MRARSKDASVRPESEERGERHGGRVEERPQASGRAAAHFDAAPPVRELPPRFASRRDELPYRVVAREPVRQKPSWKQRTADAGQRSHLSRLTTSTSIGSPARTSAHCAAWRAQRSVSACAPAISRCSASNATRFTLVEQARLQFAVAELARHSVCDGAFSDGARIDAGLLLPRDRADATPRRGHHAVLHGIGHDPAQPRIVCRRFRRDRHNQAIDQDIGRVEDGDREHEQRLESARHEMRHARMTTESGAPRRLGRSPRRRQPAPARE